MYRTRTCSAASAIVGTLIFFATGIVAADQLGATGIVASIEKAPVIADGDVTGKPFDYVITLDGSLDPQVLGRGLGAGGTIKIFFPPEFDLSNLDPAYPVSTPPLSPVLPCVPGDLQCTTAVVLRGWPQDPLFPPFQFHLLSIDEAANAVVLTAEKDIGLVAGADRAPYIKQIHLILHGLRNPAPGKYTLRVEAETGPDGTVETGEGIVRVLARTRPSINLTSVLVDALVGGACGPGQLPPNPTNPAYQTTLVGEDAPFVWTFLLWGRNSEPLDKVKLIRVGRNHYLMLRKEAGKFRFRNVIGRIRVDVPPGARGHKVTLNNDDPMFDCPTLLPAAPVIATTMGIGPQPVGRLDLRFRAGDKPGVYKTTLWMQDGNSVEMTVTATEP